MALLSKALSPEKLPAILILVIPTSALDLMPSVLIDRRPPANECNQVDPQVIRQVDSDHSQISKLCKSKSQSVQQPEYKRSLHSNLSRNSRF